MRIEPWRRSPLLDSPKSEIRIDFSAYIAAIAGSRGFAVATRNVKHFVHSGIALINPWDQDAENP